MRRIGIDVGGTFTDVVMVDEQSGAIWSTKVPTTPADRTVGALNGYRRILELSGSTPAQISFIGHGTTMATNMVVEHKAAKAALITTRGFRDILELRRLSRHDRADLYDLQFDNPPPLVERRWRFELDERLLANGQVEQSPDLKALQDMARQIADNSDIEAVAICLLHAYANPVHEQRVRDELKRLLPAHFITCSHEVNPEMQEYERCSSTVMNAMLGPVCGRYIHRLQGLLADEGFQGELLFMQSNGGLASAQTVAHKPIVLLESGPAGGVSAGVRSSQQTGLKGLLLGDMGGTTFDVSMIRDFRPEIRTQALLHSYAVRSPTIDIDSIGAGGGSIAWIDSVGGVHIGPQSAGADPGPACYGRGGQRPTVTDCNVILGYVDPNSFLGGEFKLDQEAAYRAVDEHLAKPLGVSVLEAAWTVRVVANALMAQAMRLMTVERGFDPRDFAYLCYGGAGPVHAIDLAQELDIQRVIVPPLPGLFSAFGMIVADRQYDDQIAVESELAALSAKHIREGCERLKQQAVDTLGSAAKAVQTTFRADCRYAGQPAAISVLIDNEDLADMAGDAIKDHIRAGFELEHKRNWNFIKPDQPIVLVNLRVQANVASGWQGLVRHADASKLGAGGATPTRNVYIDGKMQALPVYQRSQLAPHATIQGPAVIEEPSSCVIFKQGQSASLDDIGNLNIHL
jgi:N-methylhydantoinase A